MMTINPLATISGIRYSGTESEYQIYEIPEHL